MQQNKKNLTSPPVDKSRHLEMNYETPIRYKDKFFSGGTSEDSTSFFVKKRLLI